VQQSVSQRVHHPVPRDRLLPPSVPHKASQGCRRLLGVGFHGQLTIRNKRRECLHWRGIMRLGNLAKGNEANRELDEMAI
jgi:hypothetical protein